MLLLLEVSTLDTRRHILELVVTPASEPSPPEHPSLAELTVREAQSDLLEVGPLDLGPNAPATAALARERGPQPDDTRTHGA